MSIQYPAVPRRGGGGRNEHQPASRLHLAQPAKREQLPAKLLVSGAAGSGKTWTALRIAAALSKGRRFLVLDTEHRTALTYADEYGFDHLPWTPPFLTEDLVATLRDPAIYQYPCVVVDSGSHFWAGEGGTLDQAGGRFAGWKEARPLQDALHMAIQTFPQHLVICARAQMEYTQEEEQGKKVVKALGVGVKQDKDIEYEVNTALLIDRNGHSFQVTKSRAHVPELTPGYAYPPGPEGVDRFVGELMAWLNEGAARAELADIEALTATLNELGAETKRAWIRAGFPRPVDLLAEDVPRAYDWLDGHPGPSPSAVAEGQNGAVTELQPPSTAPEGDQADQHVAEGPEPAESGSTGRTRKKSS